MSTLLLTWVDVEQEFSERHERGDWPEGLAWAEFYWTGVRLHLNSEGGEPIVKRWLRETFSSGVEEGQSGMVVLKLESGVDLEVTFEVDGLDEKGAEPSPYLPSFERPSLVPGPTPSIGAEGDGTGEEYYSPPIIAFHSYKGGVGRTTHALAFAVEAVKYSGGKVLLVDGDFEAPGLSWHIRDRYPDPEVAYADLLILAHGDPDPEARESVNFVARCLENQESKGLYVLPSFRESFRWNALEIRPDHLIVGRSPFAISDLLAAVGRELGVDAIVVDLRAGLSELSAGLLLDPRVFRVLVTSMGKQSLHGIEAVAEQLRERLGPKYAAATHFVISHVPTVLRESDDLVGARELLMSALSDPTAKLDEGEVAEVVISEYLVDLVTLPLEWDGALAQLEKAGMSSRLRDLVERSPIPGSPSTAPSRDVTITEARELLASRAGQQIFAETGEATGFLRIEPLTRLAQDHRTRLPLAVVSGAKGAGKTYIFFQLIYAETWSAFTAQALKERGPRAQEDCVVPLIEPRNVDAIARAKLDAAESRINQEFGEDRIDTSLLRDRLQSRLESREDITLSNWRDFWLDAMAWRLGVEVGVEGASEQLAERLRDRQAQVVFVVDGLEDLFQDFQDSPVERRALRALLQDVPERIARVASAEVGLIILVRPDLVRAAVTQNAQQFLARYKPYALIWSHDAALKLAIWLAVDVGVLELEEGASGVAELPEATRDDRLIKLWGAKLGGAQSREARSTAWVIGVLSDFEGRIQARDVVRLVHHAASRSASQDGRFDDRLLDPRAMRQALQDWGKEKVQELAEEDKRLNQIFDRLKDVPRERKQVPLKAEELGLDNDQVEYLRRQGIIYDDDGQIYITELVRVGLDFEMGNGARPRIVSLRRKILRSS